VSVAVSASQQRARALLERQLVIALDRIEGVAKYRYSTIFWPPPNRPPPSLRVFLSSSMSVAQIIAPATFWTPNPTGITPPYVEEET
jgi:hypothetical protein